MANRLGCALIGPGNFGRSLVQALSDDTRAQLVGVLGATAEESQTGADALGGRPFASIDALLHADDVQAVLVATPSDTHVDLAALAASAGKHVFCEKPMALTVSDCDEMIGAARARDRKLMVGQVLRLITVFAEVRRLVKEGAIGEPRAIRVLRCSALRPEGDGPWRAQWRQKRENTGGLLFEVNVHEFDFMRAIMGEAAEVSAMVENFAHPSQDYEDHVIVTVRFQNGGLGVLESSTATGIGATEGLITGTNGSIHYDWGKNSVRFRTLDGEPVDVPVERDAGRSVQSELSSFARWVLHGEAPVVTSEDGRRAVQLAEAAYRSAAEKTAIPLGT